MILKLDLQLFSEKTEKPTPKKKGMLGKKDKFFKVKKLILL